jgi:hypothetical protein
VAGYASPPQPASSLNRLGGIWTNGCPTPASFPSRAG